MAEYGVYTELVTPAGTVKFNEYTQRTYVKLDGVEGLSPQVRATQRDRPGRDGMLLGRRNKSGMYPVLSGTFVHDGPATQETMRRQLQAACNSIMNTPGTLRWKPSDGKGLWRQCSVQLNEPGVQVTGDLFKTFQLPLAAKDPFIYGPAQNSLAASWSPGGGLIFPFTFPITFTPEGAIMSVVNAGDNEVYPILRVQGPATRPVLRNATTGSVLVFQSTLTVPTGSYAEINMWDETVYLNGDTSQPLDGYVDDTLGSFWSLAAGTNSVELHVLGGDQAATQLTTLWYDSYV